jgi:hypothetical protein
MALEQRHFTVTLTSGTNIGPYTIYHTSSTNGNQALLYGTSNLATGLTLAQVQGGVMVSVPSNATKIIFYNENPDVINDCPTNIVEYPLTPSTTPQPSPTPSATNGSTPVPSPSPSATNGSTPVPSPSPSATQNATPLPSPSPSATQNATPLPSPSPTLAPDYFYRIEGCNGGLDYHAPKDVYCNFGSLSAMYGEEKSIGDVVQFVLGTSGSCGGGTYCGTIVSTTFTAPAGSENAYISRIPQVAGCEDQIHCTQ